MDLFLPKSLNHITFNPENAICRSCIVFVLVISVIVVGATVLVCKPFFNGQLQLHSYFKSLDICILIFGNSRLLPLCRCLSPESLFKTTLLGPTYFGIFQYDFGNNIPSVNSYVNEYNTIK